MRRLSRRHKNRWLPLAGLLVFTLFKGIVPVGFMPGSLASGSPYILCHDDLRSAVLFDLLADQQHHPAPDTSQDTDHHHDHMDMALAAAIAPTTDAPPAHDYPDGNCDFASSFAKALTTPAHDFTPEPAVTVPPTFLVVRELSAIAYIRPLTRAPPLTATV